MKKITLFLFFMIGIFAVQKVDAQKLAHLNSLELLNMMPEKKKVDTELETLAKQKREEIDKQQKGIEDKYNLYAKEAANKSQEENQKRTEEVQKLAENLNVLRENSAKELDEKQKTLYSPIYEKAQKAIEIGRAHV